MLLAAARYGYPNAKIRALRSRKLSLQDYHFLLAAKDLTTLLSYLATTSYSSCLPATKPSTPLELPALERQLARPLLEDYAKVARSFPGKRERALIIALFRRFEAENLKLVMRALFAKVDKEGVTHLLYPLGNLSDLEWDRLWACRSITELLEHLRPDVFGQTLRHALPQFEAQGRLFPLEMALDFACFHLLRQALASLERSYDRRAAEQVILSHIDILNILWVIRLKTDYGLSPEEIINYTLPVGKAVTLACLNHLARAEGLEDFISHLPPLFQRELADIREWQEIVQRLQGWFLQILTRLLAGPPFHIGIALAYLLEKEIELANLITLLQAKTRDLSLEEIRRKLPRQFKEAAHVQAG